MTLNAGKKTSFSRGKSTEGNTLIYFNVLSYLCSLTDNDARTVVNEEILTDRCARIYINSCS